MMSFRHQAGNTVTRFEKPKDANLKAFRASLALRAEQLSGQDAISRVSRRQYGVNAESQGRSWRGLRATSVGCRATIKCIMTYGRKTSAGIAMCYLEHGRVDVSGSGGRGLGGEGVKGGLGTSSLAGEDHPQKGDKPNQTLMKDSQRHNPSTHEFIHQHGRYPCSIRLPSHQVLVA